jgi:hypothetical protein
MSRVERIVTSLEVSRKLKGLGILQESCFYWVKVEYWPEGEQWALGFLDPWRYDDWKKDEGYFYVFSDDTIEHIHYGTDKLSDIQEYVSAFTVTELGAMLRKSITGYFNPNSEASMVIQHLEYVYKTCNDSGKKICIDKLNQNLEKWREG